MATEIETKLVVLSEEPGRLMDEIACRPAYGQYSLDPEETRLFTDTYYDTPGRSLSAQGIAVRIRHIGDSYIFCIKHGEHIRTDGTALREELEMPWSPACIDHVLRIMNRAYAESIVVPPDRIEPDAAMSCMGIEPIQVRRTERKTFALSRFYHEETLAELALDKVCYCIQGCCIYHHEIEVEALDPSNENHIVLFTDILRTTYPDELMRWDHNKLVTGMALERLAKEGILEIRGSSSMHLSRLCYELIDAWLKGPP